MIKNDEYLFQLAQKYELCGKHKKAKKLYFELGVDGDLVALERYKELTNYLNGKKISKMNKFLNNTVAIATGVLFIFFITLISFNMFNVFLIKTPDIKINTSLDNLLKIKQENTIFSKKSVLMYNLNSFNYQITEEDITSELYVDKNIDLNKINSKVYEEFNYIKENNKGVKKIVLDIRLFKKRDIIAKAVWDSNYPNRYALYK